jgi:hypothetical protein
MDDSDAARLVEALRSGSDAAAEGAAVAMAQALEAEAADRAGDGTGAAALLPRLLALGLVPALEQLVGRASVTSRLLLALTRLFCERRSYALSC